MEVLQSLRPNSPNRLVRRKVSHPIDAIRIRSLKNVAQKLELGLVSVEALRADIVFIEDLVKCLEATTDSGSVQVLNESTPPLKTILKYLFLDAQTYLVFRSCGGVDALQAIDVAAGTNLVALGPSEREQEKASRTVPADVRVALKQLNGKAKAATLPIRKRELEQEVSDPNGVATSGVVQAGPARMPGESSHAPYFEASNSIKIAKELSEAIDTPFHGRPQSSPITYPSKRSSAQSSQLAKPPSTKLSPLVGSQLAASIETQTARYSPVGLGVPSASLMAPIGRTDKETLKSDAMYRCLPQPPNETTLKASYKSLDEIFISLQKETSDDMEFFESVVLQDCPAEIIFHHGMLLRLLLKRLQSIEQSQNLKEVTRWSQYSEVTALVALMGATLNRMRSTSIGMTAPPFPELWSETSTPNAVGVSDTLSVVGTIFLRMATVSYQQGSQTKAGILWTIQEGLEYVAKVCEHCLENDCPLDLLHFKPFLEELGHLLNFMSEIECGQSIIGGIGPQVRLHMNGTSPFPQGSRILLSGFRIVEVLSRSVPVDVLRDTLPIAVQAGARLVICDGAIENNRPWIFSICRDLLDRLGDSFMGDLDLCMKYVQAIQAIHLYHCGEDVGQSEESSTELNDHYLNFIDALGILDNEAAMNTAFAVLKQAHVSLDPDDGIQKGTLQVLKLLAHTNANVRSFMYSCIEKVIATEEPPVWELAVTTDCVYQIAAFGLYDTETETRNHAFDIIKHINAKANHNSALEKTLVCVLPFLEGYIVEDTDMWKVVRDVHSRIERTDEELLRSSIVCSLCRLLFHISSECRAYALRKLLLQSQSEKGHDHHTFDEILRFAEAMKLAEHEEIDPIPPTAHESARDLYATMWDSHLEGELRVSLARRFASVAAYSFDGEVQELCTPSHLKSAQDRCESKTATSRERAVCVLIFLELCKAYVHHHEGRNVVAQFVGFLCHMMFTDGTLSGKVMAILSIIGFDDEVMRALRHRCVDVFTQDERVQSPSNSDRPQPETNLSNQGPIKMPYSLRRNFQIPISIDYYQMRSVYEPYVPNLHAALRQMLVTKYERETNPASGTSLVRLLVDQCTVFGVSSSMSFLADLENLLSLVPMTNSYISLESAIEALGYVGLYARDLGASHDDDAIIPLMYLCDSLLDHCAIFEQGTPRHGTIGMAREHFARECLTTLCQGFSVHESFSHPGLYDAYGPGWSIPLPPNLTRRGIRKTVSTIEKLLSSCMMGRCEWEGEFLQILGQIHVSVIEAMDALGEEAAVFDPTIAQCICRVLVHVEQSRQFMLNFGAHAYSGQEIGQSFAASVTMGTESARRMSEGFGSLKQSYTVVVKILRRCAEHDTNDFARRSLVTSTTIAVAALHSLMRTSQGLIRGPIPSSSMVDDAKALCQQLLKNALELGDAFYPFSALTNLIMTHSMCGHDVLLGNQTYLDALAQGVLHRRTDCIAYRTESLRQIGAYVYARSLLAKTDALQDAFAIHPSILCAFVERTFTEALTVLLENPSSSLRYSLFALVRQALGAWTNLALDSIARHYVNLEPIAELFDFMGHLENPLIEENAAAMQQAHALLNEICHMITSIFSDPSLTLGELGPESSLGDRNADTLLGLIKHFEVFVPTLIRYLKESLDDLSDYEDLLSENETFVPMRELREAYVEQMRLLIEASNMMRACLCASEHFHGPILKFLLNPPGNHMETGELSVLSEMIGYVMTLDTEVAGQHVTAFLRPQLMAALESLLQAIMLTLQLGPQTQLQTILSTGQNVLVILEFMSESIGTRVSYDSTGLDDTATGTIWLLGQIYRMRTDVRIASQANERIVTAAGNRIASNLCKTYSMVNVNGLIDDLGLLAAFVEGHADLPDFGGRSCSDAIRHCLAMLGSGWHVELWGAVLCLVDILLNAGTKGTTALLSARVPVTESLPIAMVNRISKYNGQLNQKVTHALGAYDLILDAVQEHINTLVQRSELRSEQSGAIMEIGMRIFLSLCSTPEGVAALARRSVPAYLCQEVLLKSRTLYSRHNKSFNVWVRCIREWSMRVLMAMSMSSVGRSVLRRCDYILDVISDLLVNDKNSPSVSYQLQCIALLLLRNMSANKEGCGGLGKHAWFTNAEMVRAVVALAGALTEDLAGLVAHETSYLTHQRNLIQGIVGAAEVDDLLRANARQRVLFCERSFLALHCLHMTVWDSSRAKTAVRQSGAVRMLQSLREERIMNKAHGLVGISRVGAIILDITNVTNELWNVLEEFRS
eukprot:Clim_evm45s142 gene=Clim_evmTU45s142